MDIRFTRRTAFLIFWDIASTFAAYYFASVLTGLVLELFDTHEIYFLIGTAVVINLLLFLGFRLYNNLWEYASIDDALRITVACCLGTW